MKILFAVNTLSSGGAERVASILSNAWAAEGHEVILTQTYSGGPVTFYKLAPVIRHTALAKRGSAGGIYGAVVRLLAFRRIVRREKPDVIISFMLNANAFVMLATLFLRVPRIIAERTDPKAVAISCALRRACRFFYPRAELVVVQTEEQNKRVAEAFGMIRRTAVIPNPLPEGLPPPRQRPVKCGRKILISLGRLSSTKRIDIVIEAFCRVAGQAPDWDLHVYGDGPCRATWQAQAEQSPFRDRILFKGRTDQAYTVLSKADMFIMASEFEGFPNSLLEAMALGLPVITSDCPCAAKDITRNGEDGVLVPVGDTIAFANALQRLMESDDARAKLGARAAKSVRKRFALAKVLALWDEAFLIAKEPK